MIVRLAETARDDLLEIWRYVAGDSVAAAERQLERLQAAVQRIGDSPEIGVARDDLRDGQRVLRIDRYVIFYRRREGRLIVERILHASRDATRLDF